MNAIQDTIRDKRNAFLCNTMHIAFAIVVFIAGVSVAILSVGGIIGTFSAMLHDRAPLILFGFVSSWFGLVSSIGIMWLSRKLAEYANVQSQASQASQAPRHMPVAPTPPPNTVVSILIEHPSGHLELGTASKFENTS